MQMFWTLRRSPRCSELFLSLRESDRPGPCGSCGGRVSSQVRTRRAGGASGFRTVRPPREQSGPILAEQERSQRRRLEVLIRREQRRGGVRPKWRWRHRPRGFRNR